MVFYDKYDQFMDLKILLMHKYTILNYFSIWYASLQLCGRRPNVQGKTGEGCQTIPYQTPNRQENAASQFQVSRCAIQVVIPLCPLEWRQDFHMH